MKHTLEMRNIVKRFPGVLANNRVNLTIQSGEIHALVGENGAGKSTLMQILYGFHAMDSGEIFDRRANACIWRARKMPSRAASAWCIRNSCWCGHFRWPKTPCSVCGMAAGRSSICRKLRPGCAI